VTNEVVSTFIVFTVISIIACFTVNTRTIVAVCAFAATLVVTAALAGRLR